MIITGANCHRITLLQPDIQIFDISSCAMFDFPAVTLALHLWLFSPYLFFSPPLLYFHVWICAFFSVVHISFHTQPSVRIVAFNARQTNRKPTNGSLFTNKKSRQFETNAWFHARIKICKLFSRHGVHKGCVEKWWYICNVECVHATIKNVL